MQPKNTICLWYDKDALEAARFYVRQAKQELAHLQGDASPGQHDHA